MSRPCASFWSAPVPWRFGLRSSLTPPKTTGEFRSFSTSPSFWLRAFPVLLCALFLSSVASRLLAAEPGVEFFENKIRPLFAENCYSCHGEEKQKGKLR